MSDIFSQTANMVRRNATRFVEGDGWLVASGVRRDGNAVTRVDVRRSPTEVVGVDMAGSRPTPSAIAAAENVMRSKFGDGAASLMHKAMAAFADDIWEARVD